jgi:hypothetical protein
MIFHGHITQRINVKPVMGRDDQQTDIDRVSKLDSGNMIHVWLQLRAFYGHYGISTMLSHTMSAILIS